MFNLLQLSFVPLTGFSIATAADGVAQKKDKHEFSEMKLKSFKLMDTS